VEVIEISLYAANRGAILPVSNNNKPLIISLLPAFTGVHGSEHEHFGVLRAVLGVLRAILGEIDYGSTNSP
jgi:hypothetical protein